MTIADAPEAALDETAGSGRTALYRLYSADDELLYIGISDDLITRMQGHAQVQPWWGEVERKTVVWYPYRTQAETAETIAIGLEQPKHNKAKRYVRLPEQQFPASRHPVARRLREAAAAKETPACLTPESSADDNSNVYWGDPGWHLKAYRLRIDPDTFVPIDWPSGMWARVYLESGTSTEVVSSIICREGRMLDVLRLRSDPEEYGFGGPHYAWVQPDNPKAHGRRLRFETPWSAHSWITEDARGFTPWHQELQHKFLNALASKGRCLKIQTGSAAYASGFESKLEAQCAGAVLRWLFCGGKRHGLDAQFAIAAILNASHPGTGYGCTQCRRIYVDDADRQLFCWRCRRSMIELQGRMEDRPKGRGMERIYYFPDSA